MPQSPIPLGRRALFVLLLGLASTQLACSDSVAQPLAEESETQASTNEGAAASATARAALNHPFPRRVKAPPLDGGIDWINTSGPIELQALRGKFVLLDFWTYCCINCIHVLPELEKLEKKYPNELVVIGVHSAKFETERESKNITEAVLRYGIEHPVVNDANHAIWNTYGVNSWPTTVLIDPEGYAVYARSGEFKAEEYDSILKRAIPYYRAKGLLDATPLRFDLAKYSADVTPLRYPGKVLADETSNRLFIADSSHHRIVVTDLNGKLLSVIGNGVRGASDGDFQTASFNNPQGMALRDETLYVADTDNHMLRAVDLATETITTIAGIGEQARGFVATSRSRASDPSKIALNSPWDLLIHDRKLYIAMAGPHQIWMMPLDGSKIGPYAGNGREDIVDGPLLPSQPGQLGYSSFAQPSGLATDGEWLYVADSEGASIRAVPFSPHDNVRTLIGTAHLPYNRLFTFGDVDGVGEEVLLQHPLGLAFADGLLYVADTYNNKIKAINVKTRECRTIAGTKEPGATDNPPRFDEPAGLSVAAGKLYVADTNNHLIRVIDLASRQTSTLSIDGLEPPAKPAPTVATDDVDKEIPVETQTVTATDGEITLNVALELPSGYKMNPLAPLRYQVSSDDESGVVDRSALGKSEKVDPPTSEFAIRLPVSEATGRDNLRVSVTYYYCQDGAEGLCKVGSVAWIAPIEVTREAKTSAIALNHSIK